MNAFTPINSGAKRCMGVGVQLARVIHVFPAIQQENCHTASFDAVQDGMSRSPSGTCGCGVSLCSWHGAVVMKPYQPFAGKTSLFLVLQIMC